MAIDLRYIALCCAFGALGACGYSGEGLWPDATERAQLEIPPGIGAGDTQPTTPLPVPEARPVPPPMPLPTPVVVEATPRARSTAVAARTPAPTDSAASNLLHQHAVALDNELSALAGLIDNQRAEYQELAGGVAQSAQLHAAVMTALNERIRQGASPDDPILVSQWRAAQSALEAVNAAYANRLRALGDRIEDNRGMTTYLTESTRAASAVRTALGVDQGQINVVASGVQEIAGENERLLAAIDGAVNRHGTQSPPLPTRAANDAASVSEPVTLAAMPPPAPPPNPPPLSNAMVDSGALITIRFNGRDVAYEQALFDAVSAALESRPDARFELVAVTPPATTRQETETNARNASRNAERVARSLLAMNLPADRLDMAFTTGTDASGNEIRLFVR